MFNYGIIIQRTPDEIAVYRMNLTGNLLSPTYFM
jgi:hypothetical protein